MNVNILIGIGGTGAKIVESTLHATAAGLGPKSLLVGFVDQDQSNGNVERSKRLLSLLADVRSAWRGDAAHRLGQESDLFASHIAALAPGAEVWTPSQGQGQTLSRIFGKSAMSSEDQNLFDMFFAPGPLEQDMVLDEGYRGRPHTGAAAMASQVDDENPFWKALLHTISQARGGAKVRLVLAGSVFGGTGAAGFPTIARLIRRRLERENITQNVLIGGALMLPYFGFAPPDDKEANVARSEELLMQSREALKYYHELFNERVFDELYFVGWDPPFQLGYHSPGAGEQANPALLPELIAAMGVCRFFDARREPGGDNNGVMVCGRESVGVVAWSDLPTPFDAEPDAPFHRLGQLLRFSVAWLHWRDLLGKKRGMLGGLMKKDDWYQLQKVGEVDFRNAPPEQQFSRLSLYLRELIAWAASIEHYCAAGLLDFRLWTTRGVATTTGKPNADFVSVADALGEDAYGAAFSEIVAARDVSDPLPNSNNLLLQLSTQRMEGDHAGIGRIVAALHAHSAVTTTS
jgi:hypothetical protein